MKWLWAGRHRLRLALALASVFMSCRLQAEPGLLWEVKGGGAAIAAVVSNVLFTVDSGGTPHPEIPRGPFTARWTGQVVVPLRGDYEFRFEHSGNARLVVLGTNTLFQPGASAPEWSAPVRLRKGSNTVEVTLERTNLEPAFVRLWWRGRGVAAGPVPTSAFESGPLPPEVALTSERQRGRDLFLALRCSRCHLPPPWPDLPDLALPAPSLVDIGTRRHASWIKSWLLNPTVEGGAGEMPRTLQDATADAEAEALTAWLTWNSVNQLPTKPSGAAGDPRRGAELFERNRCQACHVRAGDSAMEGRRSLATVGKKYPADALAEFLLRPEAHAPASKMPNFGLSTADAADLAAHLLGNSGEPWEAKVPVESLAKRGAELAVTRGCLACHEPRPAPPPGAPPLSRMTTESWDRGCLSATPAGGGTSPRFSLTSPQRAALAAWGRGGWNSLQRIVPADNARRWTERLGCGGCHDAGLSVPTLAFAGEKLKPEFLRALLEGTVAKPSRPWLDGRMPAFPAYARPLAEGLAATHGFPPHTTPEAALDPVLAEKGRKLVSASGGFACVTCHAVGAFQEDARFEAPGINFARVTDRLRRSYFDRWMRNPQAVDPGSRMPLYFDEQGRSALPGEDEGDGQRTLDALWEYLRMGSAIRPPDP